MSSTERQQEAFELQYSTISEEAWSFERSPDPVVRYLRDRRVMTAVERLMDITGSRPGEWDALVLCGGPGGEGSLLANLGFKSVTVSDVSIKAAQLCAKLDPRLQTLVLDAENINLPAHTFDLVIVQDGLHHLPRPTLGLTEMVRVARRGVIVIEPHDGLVARLLGTEWERTQNEINYVFRWNRWLFTQLVRGVLLFGDNTERIVREARIDPAAPFRLKPSGPAEPSYVIDVIRLWDSHFAMRKIAALLGGGTFALSAVKFLYAVMGILLYRCGNQFLGILAKDVPGKATQR